MARGREELDEELEGVSGQLESIQSGIDELLALGRANQMADQEELDIIAQINDTTNQMAADAATVDARLTALQSQVKVGMTPEEVATVKAALSGASDAQKVIAANLKATASNPAAPAPTPSPLPPAPAPVP